MSEVPKRLVLSGPMSGCTEYNFPAFNRAAEILRAAGFEVFNPAENFDGDASHSREEYMSLDLSAVIDRDAVVVLPGWCESQGANTEVMVAWQCGKPVFSFAFSEGDGGFELTPLVARPARLPYSLEVPDDRSINLIAEDLINGARRSTYGMPLDDYSRVAGSINVNFLHILKPGCGFRPEDIPIIIQFMKISREIHCPKRDNRIDGAGYWGVAEMIHQERGRRAASGGCSGSSAVAED